MSLVTDSVFLPLRYLRWWLAAGGLILTVIMVLSLMPLEFPPGTSAPNDKLMHAGAFLFLMLWFSGIVVRSHYWLLALLLLLYGAGMEVLQSLTEFRMGEWADFVADGAGLALGWVVASFGAAAWCRAIETRLIRESAQ
jgi:VanZ family protein